MIELKRPIINPTLVEAMQAVLKDNSEKNRSRMAEVLAGSRLIAPVKYQVGAKEENKGLTRLTFARVRNQDGVPYYTVFTDIGEMNKWKKEASGSAMLMDFDDLAGLMENPSDQTAGFVINPFGENITISRELMESLKQQKDMRDEEKGE